MLGAQSAMPGAVNFFRNFKSREIVVNHEIINLLVVFLIFAEVETIDWMMVFQLHLHRQKVELFNKIINYDLSKLIQLTAKDSLKIDLTL